MVIFNYDIVISFYLTYLLTLSLSISLIYGSLVVIVSAPDA